MVEEVGKVWQATRDFMAKSGIDIENGKVLLPSGMDINGWFEKLKNYNKAKEMVTNHRDELAQQGLQKLTDAVIARGEVAWKDVDDADKAKIKELLGDALKADPEKVTLELLNEILSKISTNLHPAVSKPDDAAAILAKIDSNMPVSIKDALNDDSKKETLEKALSLIGLGTGTLDEKTLKKTMSAVGAGDFNDFMAKVRSWLEEIKSIDEAVKAKQEALKNKTFQRR